MDICCGMQGKKLARLKWNKILNLLIYSLGFIKHITDHDIYTLKTNYTNDILIFGCSTDDLLCAYSSIHLFKNSLEGINKHFPVISKEGSKLS